MAIDRVRNISPEDFVSSFMLPNRPVVIEGALDGWRLEERWSPQYLESVAGDRRTQVYNNYFDLQDDPTLSEFLRDEFDPGKPRSSGCRYVRWYTRLRDVDFDWADEVFELLAPNWEPLPFLPPTGYVLPFGGAERRLDPRRDLFPAKGLFISGRGARTSLHVDPWGSDAVLCQLHGRKRWTMYDPSQAPYLQGAGKIVDPDDVDVGAFPRFHEARPTHEFDLVAGEVVYVPHGWYHHVVTETPSISLTWNFVHASTADSFLRWLEASEPGSNDREIARYFVGDDDPRMLRDRVSALRSAMAG